MKKNTLFTFILLTLAMMACQTKEQPWQTLFNGADLSDWDTYIGTPLKGFDSLALNATTEKVFSVVQQDGMNLMRISGEVNGSLATREVYENYHLRLVYKWGDSVYTSRNSGLLYHGFGEFGAALGTWMVNIECQLMNGNLGDTYLMNNTACETSAVKNDSTGFFVFTPGAPLASFGEHANGKSIKKMVNAEKEIGEWNTVDLYCFGTTSVHVVNGVTVMVNTNTGVFENGTVRPLQAGKIQLQSEGAEMFVKSIELQPITKLPKEILPE